MKDPYQLAREMVDIPGFEPMNQFLIGNITFAEAAAEVLSEIVHSKKKVFEDIDELKEQLEEKDSEISVLEEKLRDLHKRLRQGGDPKKILEDHLNDL